VLEEPTTILVFIVTVAISGTKPFHPAEVAAVDKL
jgi:hypothetical protein